MVKMGSPDFCQGYPRTKLEFVDYVTLGQVSGQYRPGR